MESIKHFRSDSGFLVFSSLNQSVSGDFLDGEAIFFHGSIGGLILIFYEDCFHRDSEFLRWEINLIDRLKKDIREFWVRRLEN